MTLILTLMIIPFIGEAQNNLPNQNLINMESVAPNIFVKDIQKTIKFYQILGFQVIAKNPDTNNPDFVLMSCDKVTFMFQIFSSIGDDLPSIKRDDGGSLLLYIQLTGIVDFHKKIKDKVEVYKELEETFYGAKEFSIIDNNNYILTFAEHGR